MRFSGFFSTDIWRVQGGTTSEKNGSLEFSCLCLVMCEFEICVRYFAAPTATVRATEGGLSSWFCVLCFVFIFFYFHFD